MQNLAHSASFESLDKDAPSKAETKQLARLAMSRLADSFRGEFVHFSDLVCAIRLIA